MPLWEQRQSPSWVSNVSILGDTGIVQGTNVTVDCLQEMIGTEFMAVYSTGNVSGNFCGGGFRKDITTVCLILLAESLQMMIKKCLYRPQQ
jgi:hypothetical protein